MENRTEILNHYEKYLIKNEMSDNTILSYMWTATFFLENYNSFSKSNILKYKKYLMENFKITTVNSRIQALNRFLIYNHKKNLCLKTVKLQRQPFLDNVISNAEYRRLLTNLKKDNRMKYYIIVRVLACTGARISELVQFQIEDIEEGYRDIYAKGGKMRRIYFTKILQNEIKEWLSSEGRTTGPIFLNKNGVTISVRGIESMLKRYAIEYHINKDVVHPHSFRHRFALNFLKKRPNQLVALADILGHSNINTTRIYLLRTSREQYNLINSTVDW